MANEQTHRLGEIMTETVCLTCGEPKPTMQDCCEQCTKELQDIGDEIRQAHEDSQNTGDMLVGLAVIFLIGLVLYYAGCKALSMMDLI